MKSYKWHQWIALGFWTAGACNSLQTGNGSLMWIGWGLILFTLIISLATLE